VKWIEESTEVTLYVVNSMSCARSNTFRIYVVEPLLKGHP